MNSKKLFSFLLVASIMLTGCGGNDKTATSSEPSDTQKTAELTIDKNGKKEESKDTDSKKQEKETSSSTKNETNSSKNKTSTNDSKDSGNKPAENSKPSKPANSGAVNKPSTSKPAPAPSKPAPSKPNKPAPSEPAKPSKPAHQHDWKTEYKTVHHEAQYRNEPVYKDEIVYENRPVYKWQAYWTCNGCGQRFNSENDVLEHVLLECGTGYTPHEEKVQTGTEQVQVGTNRVQVGTNPVLVKDAWDEKVPNGQSCSCGARK